MIYGDRRTRLQRFPRPVRIAVDWVVTITAAILIVLAIKGWVINPYRIPSSSMEPTLHCARPASGCQAHWSDRVLANRFVYDFRSPQRAEIIVFEAPTHACGTGGTFVKRLIGVPGDRLRERDGRWWINGTRLHDSGYVQTSRRDHGSGFWTVGQGQYFFLGDNRSSSCDSRTWGTVPRSRLIGPVIATYWPPSRVSINTPGAAGGGILASLALLLGGFAVVARRRRRGRTSS